MDLLKLAKNIDVNTARAFVTAARQVIDALLIESQRAAQTRTPPPQDYRQAGLPRQTPAGGWISHDELRQTAREMSEAMAAEKWIDGLLAGLKLLAILGGAL